jgi:hypothetical protein
MRKAIFLLPLMVFATTVNAQKIRYDRKTLQVTSDGQYVCSIEKIKKGKIVQKISFDIFDKNGDKVIQVNWIEAYDLKKRICIPSPPNGFPTGNPFGRTVCYEFVFLATQQRAEIDYVGMQCGNIASILIKNGIFADGLLDINSVQQFVKTTGRPYHDHIDHKGYYFTYRKKDKQ